MNKLITVTCMMIATLMVFSCSRKDSDDSRDIAEDTNDAKFGSDYEGDAKFVVEAADGGLLEVQLGKLAQTKAFSAEVKQLGQMMAEDHSKANEELVQLASKKNISLPVVMSDENQKKYDDLAAKTGEDFDEAYTEFMVKDHKKDIDKFKKEFDKGEDNDIRTWASNKVTTLEHHLMMAEQAENSVKDRNKRTSRD